MKKLISKKISYLLVKMTLILLVCMTATGCIGTVVGAVVDTAIEVVKVPFKVGAAVIDVVTEDEFTDVGKETNSDTEVLSSDSAAVKMENTDIR